MATITVTSNPSTTGDTLTINFTTDATNISDILLSKDGGSTYISATSLTSSSAVFNVSSWDNGTYNNCKLKCVYTESGGGGLHPHRRAGWLQGHCRRDGRQRLLGHHPQ